MNNCKNGPYFIYLQRVYFQLPSYEVKKWGRFCYPKLSLPVFSACNPANKMGRDLDCAAKAEDVAFPDLCNDCIRLQYSKFCVGPESCNPRL